MKRSALFLAIAIAFGVGGFSTPDARATSTSVATLIADATEINIGGGLQVLFTGYTANTPNAPSAANVFIEYGAGSGSPFTGPGGSVNYGFNVDGSFNTANGSTLDAGLSYTVSSIAGAKIITDAYAFVDAQFPGSSTGIAAATDTLNLSSGQVAFAASVSQPSIGGTNPTEISFGAQSSIVVHKDISSINFTGATEFSAISQGYSTQGVPEPASMALLGIGMTGFLAFRRFFKKTSVA